jgi:hypothetical protein
MKAAQLFTAVLALASVASFASNANAASSGSLIVSGSVSMVNSLVVTPNVANNTSLNITGGESAKNVASVAETSNDLAGYKIMMSSATGGLLVNQSNSANSTAYQVSYNGGAAQSITSAGIAVKNVASLAALTTNTSAVAVNVTAYPSAPAGVYQDTLTISIVAN